MKKRIVILLSLFLSAQFYLSAQNTKLRVAVLDPFIAGKDFDDGLGVMIREIVSSDFVNTGKYIIIERSMLSKIMQEQGFSNSGAIDDSQAVELGKLAGANKVVLITLSSYGDRGMLSLKMINVESAVVENQKAKVAGITKILDITSSLVLEMFGEPIPSVTAGSPTSIGNGRALTTTTGGKNEDGDVMGERVLLEFGGFHSSKNPTAVVYIDNKKIGEGTFNEGFSLSFSDNKPGRHEVEIKWSDIVKSKTYTIDTSYHKRFVFEHNKSSGYEFRLKK